MLENILSTLLLTLAGVTLGSFATAGDKLKIYLSSKTPGFPFSEAVAYGGVLYLSGDIGTGTNGKLVEGGIGPESRQTMNNIKATLSRHGLGMEQIIKCTVFLADISERPTFNGIYAGYFEKGRYPARSALAAAGLALSLTVLPPSNNTLVAEIRIASILCADCVDALSRGLTQPK